MKIDKSLNIVFPVQRDSGQVWVHSTPLSREAFSHHFMLISKTFTAMLDHGLATAAAPRVAMLMLEKVALELPEGADSAVAFTNELRRMTSIIVPTNEGWQPVPLHMAEERGYLGEEERDEVEGVVAFFICFSAMVPRNRRRLFAEGLTSACGGQVVSSSCMEFTSSLPTSIETVVIGTKAGLSGPR